MKKNEEVFKEKAITLEENKINSFFKTHKMKIFFVITIVISFFIGFSLVGKSLTKEEKMAKVMEVYSANGLYTALGEIDNLYKSNPTNEEVTEVKLALLRYHNKINTKIVLEKIELEKTSYDSNYGYIYLTVNNIGTIDVNYFEYDIVFYNKDGDVVGSDYGNCSSPLLAGKTVIDEAYVKIPKNADNYEVSLREL